MGIELVGEHGPELYRVKKGRVIPSVDEWKAEFYRRRSAGWVPFGTNVVPNPRFDHLEFDGVDESGMPLRERPVLRTPSIYQRVILIALSRLGKHVYPGTVPEAVKADRRRKNRVAKKSRRANHG